MEQCLILAESLCDLLLCHFVMTTLNIRLFLRYSPPRNFLHQIQDRGHRLNQQELDLLYADRYQLRLRAAFEVSRLELRKFYSAAFVVLPF